MGNGALYMEDKNICKGSGDCSDCTLWDCYYNESEEIN